MGLRKKFRGGLQTGYIQRSVGEREAACSAQPSVDFHILCRRETVKFADEIKVTGNFCEGRLGI